VKFINNDIVHQLYSDTGYNGFRIFVKDGIEYPEYKDRFMNIWKSYLKRITKLDDSKESADISFEIVSFDSATPEALHYIGKLLPDKEEESGVRRFML
jgi:hypothetical protein